MLPLQIGGIALAALVLKLRASRPHFKRERGAYSVPESAAPGAPFRRADKFPGPLATTPFPGCNTIYEVFQFAQRKNAKRRAVGTRAVLKVRARTRALCV